MSTKAKSKQEEALKFLDDLDNLPVPPVSASSQASASSANDGNAADMEKFIDDITQKKLEPARAIQPFERPPSRAGTPTLRKATERVRVGSPAPPKFDPSTNNAPAGAASNAQSAAQPVSPARDASQGASSGGGWGWGNVWSSASAALQQAKTVVDEQVKNLPNNEQAKKWSQGVMEYVPVKKEHLEKFGKDLTSVGLTTFNDILNVVAPPIAEHEVIQVSLSHDMEGYEGVESVVYRAMAKIMEQVDGGDLVVNRGGDSKPREQSTSGGRNLNAVEGVEAAFKLAKANIADLAKASDKKETSASSQNPTTYTSVYLRIQPCYVALPTSGEQTSQFLQFVLCLSDPEHSVTCSTATQVIPGKWIELWDQHDWIEDSVVESLRVGIEVVGQEYIVSRMRWLEEESPVPGIEVKSEDVSQ